MTSAGLETDMKPDATPRTKTGYLVAVLTWASAVTVIAGLLATSVAPKPRPRLLWNATASAPVGLYRIMPPDRLLKGDMVIAWVPGLWRGFADERGYLPGNVPLVKRIAAAEGDLVCSKGRNLLVNGSTVAHRLPKDSKGRILPSWHGCRMLGPDDVLLLMDKPGSFDGRYFGPSDRANLVGRAVPLWIG